MPKGFLNKFLVKRNHEVLLFGWVEAYRSALPSLSVEKTINQFFNHFEVEPEDWDMNTAKVAYQRMKEAHREKERK